MFPHKLVHFSFKTLVIPNSGVQFNLRFFGENAAKEHNIKKFKLYKRIAYTVLFGSTFLTAVWAKKNRKSDIWDSAKLVSNSHFDNKNFKLYEYKSFVLPTFVMKNMKSIEEFKCREDDIFVASFPKTGTTWLQEIVYCIYKGMDRSLSKSIEDRFPYLEFFYPGLADIERMESPRLIKTHLPYSLLPHDVHQKKPKILCIMRNPKDVAVSYYHFVRMMTISNYCGSFENFIEDFLSNKVPYGPIWKHYKEIREHQNDHNILILSYEDLHKDIRNCIKKISLFLGKNLSEEEIDAIAEHCSFKNMSKNPSSNYQHWDDLGLRKKDEAKFMRKGKVGDWKNYFSQEMNERMNSFIDENMKENIGMFAHENHNSSSLDNI